MNATFVLELGAAVAVAVTVVRYWKVIVAAIAVMVISLAVVGLMTVVQNWPLSR